MQPLLLDFQLSADAGTGKRSELCGCPRAVPPQAYGPFPRLLAGGCPNAAGLQKGRGLAQRGGKGAPDADEKRQRRMIVCIEKPFVHETKTMKRAAARKQKFQHISKTFLIIFVDIFGKLFIIQTVWLRRMIV